ncbi:phospholipase C/P1 nuclease domain-containing protein [Apiosordaria backusii]|uniref:Phospholipase C/P1 nuclease domain-containing protein n=1 Tax=Apiosordaria backusii TaxID=314023 RepID=A0AA40AN57_9PEZI|nr:phospholipase C/P1 nuclease domain-containing protein [Apiosordaria backusii]
MKVSTLAVSAAALPGALAWGGFGHITVAYIASNFVSPSTTSYLQTLLRNDTGEYLAGVATWADSIRYTKWGRFTSGFHFIDAHDNPPATAAWTTTATARRTPLLDTELPLWRRAQAAKFVVHFVGDIHQPLHTEDVARGGNGIHVTFEGKEVNLHHVWDTSIAEKLVGGIRRKPYPFAKKWADELTEEIKSGKYAAESKDGWLRGTNITDPIATALRWAVEGNALVCTTVLPEGAEAIGGQELGGEYYDKAAPVVEKQVAKAGFRLAAWLDLIISSLKTLELPASSEPEPDLDSDSPGDL